MKELGSFLLATALLSGVADAQKLDRKLERSIKDLATEWFEARPPSYFEEWDPAVRAELLARAEELGPIPEGSLETVVELLWKAARKEGPSWKKSEFDTPFGEASWIRDGKGGAKKGLVIGLHGGGQDAGEAGEAAGNWGAKNCMGIYPQGIRLVSDTWNTVHGERFVLTLIEHAKLRYEVDPDRVYSMGFSMGGTGSWFFAGRHPDLLAGAIPAHGVIMASPQAQLQTPEEVRSMQHGLLPNVRNLAVWFYTGTVDENCRPGTFMYAWDRVRELAEADPGGYELVRFTLHENIAHEFPTGEPDAGVDFVTSHVRDTHPTKLVWEYAARPYPLPERDDPLPRLEKPWFYWLHTSAPERSDAA